MTDFTPEHYLAAARIAEPETEWRIQYFIDAWTITCLSEDAFLGASGVKRQRAQFNPWLDDSDYRALREALDKEYGITIQWSIADKKWLSVSGIHPVGAMLDDDITRLMMKNIVALVEAGVVE